MNTRKTLILAGAAAVLLALGVGLYAHRSASQSEAAGGPVFADLKAALGDVEEIRLSKGDGSKTTLRRTAGGWQVVERNYPADVARVRELALALAALKRVEAKTSDPANYPKLGVENPDSPTAASTLVEVVAGRKSWPLIVGKSAEGRAIYLRKPGEAASALATPALTVDPDQKRWIDRQLTDVAGAEVREIAVQPASGPAYTLTRAKHGDVDLVLAPLPKGRKPASSMSIDAQADALGAFNFDDVHALPAAPAAITDHATYTTFDGQVLEFAGRRDGQKAFLRVSARRDATLAAPVPPAAPTPAPAAPAGTPATPAAATAPAKPADQTAERLAARAAGVEFEIPVYKYESLFKPQEELLEKPPAPPTPSKAAAGKAPSKEQ